MKIKICKHFSNIKKFRKKLTKAFPDDTVIVKSCIGMYKTCKQHPVAKVNRLKVKWINKGNSVIADPDGEVLSGPLNAEEGILIAEIDLHMLDASKWNLDVAGHYARPDAFELTIRKSATPIIRIK